MRLLAISGSLRLGSHNSALPAAAAVACPPGVEFVTWQRLAETPPFNEDLDIPPTVIALQQEIAQADAVLVATPEYNGSFPGALKNALDWVSRPFATNVLRDKPVAVIGASQGMFGAVRAQADLRRVLSRIGASVDDRELPVGLAAEAFTADTRLRDPALAARLRAIVENLTATARPGEQRDAQTARAHRTSRPLGRTTRQTPPNSVTFWQRIWPGFLSPT